MKSRYLFLGTALAGLAAQAAHAGTVLPFLGPALDYVLIGSPEVASAGPAPINPGVLVGLNPQPLPPLPDPGVSLDLTNPGGPVYTYPASTAGLEVFTISWGMDAGGAVSFTPPIPTPGDPNQLTFTGIAQSGDYLVTLTLSGANPGSFVELNPQPLPPFPAPGFGFIGFGFSAGGDPRLTFNVVSGNTVYAFAPAPEPSTLALCALALAVLALRLGRGASSRRA